MQREAPNHLDPRTAGGDQAAAPRLRQEVDVPAAVVWHDGMPLSPQHFQESFRRTERLFDFHLGLVAPYHYGVLRLEIDGGRLGSGVLHIDVEAVMPDRLQARASADELSIKLDPAELRKRASAGPRRARANEFDVFLTVPWEQDGRAAVGNLPRYRTAMGDAVTDDTTGESKLEISRLVPNVQLVVDVKPPTSSTWIRIAKVRLDGDGFVRAEHVPPLLAVSREPHARVLYDLCSRLVERVRNTARRLSERRAALSKSVDRTASTDGIAADDRELLVETKRQIQSLVSGLPPFEALLHTEQAHPFPLYIALAGLVGSVAGLARSLVPPVLSTYRHDDLLATFEEAATHVETMMREGIVESFAPHPLVAAEGRYQVDFPRSWMGRQLVLAVRGLRGVEEGDVTVWMRSAIIASLSEAARVRGNRALGIDRDRVDRLDDLFPAGGELLFKLKDASAVLLPDQLLTVFNPKDTVSDLGAFEIVLYVKEPPSEPQGTNPRSPVG
jgi:type VI secretion system protein ImpJ